MIGPLKKQFAAVLVLLVLTVSVQPVVAQGLDRIRDRNGTTTGKITQMSALGVVITKNGVETKKRSEEILSITFAGEPAELSPARRAAKSGRFESALEKLGKIKQSGVTRAEIEQEIEFLTTFCQAKLALSGQGTLRGARKEIASFLGKNKKNYHMPEALELLGDVLMASEDYSGARSQYSKLAGAKTAFYKARSAILVGRTWQAEGKHKEAITSFETGLQAAQGKGSAKTLVLEVQLLRAISQSALGQTAASIKIVKEIIQQADVTDANLLAQAYNALGDCYLQAGKKQEARQAFLHVDLLFSSDAAEHAKALHQLSTLWGELGQSDRAKDAQARLKKKYPGSRWVKR